ncbi:transcription factor HES-5-like [Clarias magur]|uniref:Transcription factor HES-5 n=1 Tax=Clarias magur TaxID=1594786 RepID=A0A8J4X2W6_CLAMG|nr:transcription factor HES-5-like [Clarias magur]
MAPAITSSLTISNEHLPLNNKMRKPMVEKMRRDRINSSIEQLKSLLAPEFLNQQPDSKLEKADILEITVSFLRQKQKQQPAFSFSSPAVNQGFSRCVHDVVHFLSKEEVKTQSQRKLLNHFQDLQPSSDENKKESVLPRLSSTEQQINSKEKSSVKSALWRPWTGCLNCSVMSTMCVEEFFK